MGLAARAQHPLALPVTEVKVPLAALRQMAVLGPVRGALSLAAAAAARVAAAVERGGPVEAQEAIAETGERVETVKTCMDCRVSREPLIAALLAAALGRQEVFSVASPVFITTHRLAVEVALGYLVKALLGSVATLHLDRAVPAPAAVG